MDTYDWTLIAISVLSLVSTVILGVRSTRPRSVPPGLPRYRRRLPVSP